jgi:hypothetical protein
VTEQERLAAALEYQGATAAPPTIAQQLAKVPSRLVGALKALGTGSSYGSAEPVNAVNDLARANFWRGSVFGVPEDVKQRNIDRAAEIAATFIGPKAKSWNAEANARALQMEKAGATPETIWQETGNWKAPDSAWRQEISDKGSKITENVYRGISENQKFKGLLEQGLSHNELYAAYPELKGIHSNFFAAAEPSGNFIPNARTMTVAGPDTIKQRSTALHELQHAIQQKEGFARGGSPESMTMTLEEIAQEKRQKAKELFNLSKANDPLDPGRIVKPGARKKGLQLEREAQDLDSKAVIANLSGQARFDLYRRLAGEAEARATQKRRNLTDEQRRAEFPERSYDVPINELIIRR